MGINIPAGDKIPLRILLETRVTNRFVRATVRNHVGTEIVGSPLNVPHLANGFHSDDSLNMPDVPHITVEYDIFKDSGFTTKDLTLFPDAERFDLDDLGTAINDLKLAARGAGLEAEISSGSFVAEIDESGTNLEGTLEDGSLSGDIGIDTDLSATISSTNLEGDIEC